VRGSGAGRVDGAAGRSPHGRGRRGRPAARGAGLAFLGGLACLGVAGALLACGGAGDGEPPAEGPPLEARAGHEGTGPEAPVGVRGAVILEPPRVAVGQVVQAEIAVVTPPQHWVSPPEPPQVPGFWVLEARPLAVEREAGRWIHRIAVRLRGREVGPSAWPAMRLAVEGPDGEVGSVEIPERPLEVVSVRRELPEREEPFGLVPPPRGGGRLGLLVAAGAGALATLATLGGVVLWRRRRGARQRAAVEAVPAPLAAWREARGELEASLAAVVSNPRAGAERAALALRRYAQGRWGAPVRASTTPELESLRPPYGARSVWPRLLALLQRLDAVRFQPRAGEPEELEEALREALRLVEETPPPQVPPGALGARGADR